MLRVRLRLRRASFALEAEFELAERSAGLLGPSGAGKTTLLAALAGLAKPDEGRVELEGEVLFDSAAGIDVPVHRRRFGFVFQDSLLFPHLSVEGNLRYGWRLLGAAARRLEPSAVAALLDLTPLGARAPATLSGGERQRVALGRALLTSPRLLLLDEPLAGVDPARKERILPYLARVRDELGIPFLYVTHQAGEVLLLTRRILVLDAGRLVADGDYLDVLDRTSPGGQDNYLEAEVASPDPAAGTTRVRWGSIDLEIPSRSHAPGERLLLAVRSNEIALARTNPTGISIRNRFPVVVERVAAVPGTGRVLVAVRPEPASARPLVVEVTPSAVAELDLAPGRTAWCLVKTLALRVAGGAGA